MFKVQIMLVKALLLMPSHCKISVKIRDLTVRISKKLNFGE